MRPVVFIAALALASCGGEEPANNTAIVQGTDAADITAVNDITAIDAATGQAANMAADVEFTVNESNLSDAGADANAADNSL